MLKFFRKIRQNLLKDGKEFTYIKYAIGEIFLLVVGILIALQINNWNEERKRGIYEKNVLLELRNALFSDLENQFDFHMQNGHLALYSLDVIHQHLALGLPFNDSLSLYFPVLAWEGNKDWSPETTAFESLKSNGVDLVSNSDLKYSILEIYNRDYPHIVRDFHTYKSNVESYGRPMLVENFILDESMSNNKLFPMKMTPISYQSLIQDVKLMNIIKFLRMANLGQVGLLSDYRIKVEAVIGLIDSELERI